MHPNLCPQVELVNAPVSSDLCVYSPQADKGAATAAELSSIFYRTTTVLFKKEKKSSRPHAKSSLLKRD